MIPSDKRKAWLAVVLVVNFALVTLDCAFAAGASKFKIKTYTLGTEEVVILALDSPTIEISKKCRRSNGKLDCEAYRKWASLKGSRAPIPIRGGQNPGAVICERIGGRSKILSDQEGNQNSFCMFSDRSLIGSDALFRKARNWN
jgi:putative hemolysin